METLNNVRKHTLTHHTSASMVALRQAIDEAKKAFKRDEKILADAKTVTINTIDWGQFGRIGIQQLSDQVGLEVEARGDVPRNEFWLSN